MCAGLGSHEPVLDEHCGVVIKAEFVFRQANGANVGGHDRGGKNVLHEVDADFGYNGFAITVEERIPVTQIKVCPGGLLEQLPNYANVMSDGPFDGAQHGGGDRGLPFGIGSRDPGKERHQMSEINLDRSFGEQRLANQEAEGFEAGTGLPSRFPQQWHSANGIEIERIHERRPVTEQTAAAPSGTALFDPTQFASIVESRIETKRQTQIETVASPRLERGGSARLDSRSVLTDVPRQIEERMVPILGEPEKGHTAGQERETRVRSARFLPSHAARTVLGHSRIGCVGLLK